MPNDPPVPLSSLAAQVAALETQNRIMKAKLALAGIPAEQMPAPETEEPPRPEVREKQETTP